MTVPSFPNSPANGQTYTENGITYTWVENGAETGYWAASGEAVTLQSVTTAGKTTDQGIITRRADATSAGVRVEDASNNPSHLLFGNGNAVFNEQGADADFRVEGDTNQNLLFVDAGQNRVGFGTASPTDFVEINGNTRVVGNVLIRSGNQLRLNSSDNSIVTNINADDATSTATYTLPPAAGTAGQVLSIDTVSSGDCELSWIDGGGGAGPGDWIYVDQTFVGGPTVDTMTLPANVMDVRIWFIDINSGNWNTASTQPGYFIAGNESGTMYNNAGNTYYQGSASFFPDNNTSGTWGSRVQWEPTRVFTHYALGNNSCGRIDIHRVFPDQNTYILISQAGNGGLVHAAGSLRLPGDMRSFQVTAGYCQGGQIRYAYRLSS